jgi:3,4-dihydroxy-2-butanone 4-phosphate synthase
MYKLVTIEKLMKVYAEVLQVKEEFSADGIICTALKKELSGSFNLPTITQRGKRNVFQKKTGGDLCAAVRSKPSVTDLQFTTTCIKVFWCIFPVLV